jgi:hypothetical protein
MAYPGNNGRGLESFFSVVYVFYYQCYTHYFVFYSIGCRSCLLLKSVVHDNYVFHVSSSNSLGMH